MREKYTPNNDQYFATLEGDELIGAIRHKIELFYDDVENMGIRDLIHRCYRAYYGGDLSKNSPLFENAKITSYGDSGQIMNLKLNHYRNLLKHTRQLSTAEKPAFVCRANNSDYKSQVQTVLGNGLIDYYMRELGMSASIGQAIENCLVQMEGWIHVPWDPSLGDIYEISTDGQPIYTGDISFTAHALLDIARDVSLGHDDEHNWLAVRSKKNRWDLIAVNPDETENLLNAVLNEEDDTGIQDFANRKVSEDLVDVWTFYHKKTPALPEGKMVQFCGDALLINMDFPYDKIPLHRLTADRIINTPYGYSPAVDIVGGQEALNILTSTIMTNQGTHGLQNVWTRRGDKIEVNMLASGSKHFQSDEMPKPLQLTSTSPEVFNFRREIIGDMQTLQGVPAAMRGNPEASLKSGSAIAIVVAQAVQFASLIDEGKDTLIGDVGTTVINHLQKFPKTERVAKLVGNFNRPFTKTFKSEDLSEINRVSVEKISPMSKTISGRAEIANQLLQQGMLENSKQYMSVLMTGQLDPAIEGAQSELLNIRAENEALQNGEIIDVIMTENHKMHIKEHKSILENPEAKKDGKLVTNTLAHIQKHINVWKATPPELLFILGFEPAPNFPAQMPQPNQPQPEGGGSGEGVVMPEEEAAMPNMPNLPKEAPPQAVNAYEGAVQNGMTPN